MYLVFALVFLDPGETNGNPLQYSCLENSMNRRAWWATVHGVVKCWLQLRNSTFLDPSLCARVRVCVHKYVCLPFK